ncbi:lipocalin-like domain-containing protein [Halomonas sp. MCCC 1A11062]|uniref:lipocalin-like domain-containing protein n=1 Tax=Halomonas sp. MCCC 1A11062 TaxID=2733485 RepID=UPI001F3454C3|nr:lipocalin-like domain-containing protein [Halomonas sp. MCCC 1A11062]MCE8040062.1 iron ABC transporter permease [Halomonas sp. MCCC 1A11062]
MKRSVALITLLAMFTLAGCAEEPPPNETAGFAGLGQEAGDFAQAHDGIRLSFPEDHAAHPDYRIEWWYLTANLEDEDGEPLGLQWTLFRQALTEPKEPPPNERPEPGPWAADQLWMAHMAVSQGETHRVAERFARSHSGQDDGQAGAVAEPFRAWIDHWQLATRVDTSDEPGDTFTELQLTAHQGDAHGGFGYDLTLVAEGPLVLHGAEGFSQKSADGQGSMYYSQPFWRVEGEVTLDGETRAVSGRGWLDREWSSQLLSPEQQGWDWFSLHLASGHKLMAFQLRGGGADGSDYRSGTWISPEGEPTALAPDEIAMTPLATRRVAGREVPTRWHLEIPRAELDLIVEAPHAERWMETSVAYWEGEVIARDAASGEDGGDERGIGYLEMTGY